MLGDISSSVVYMDDETVKECDYVVHIPYMKADSRHNSLVAS